MEIMPKDRYGGYAYAFKHFQMAPDEARAATAGLYALVEGTVRKATDGGRVECAQSKTTATMNHPYEGHWKACVISAKIERVQVISPKAGVFATLPIKEDKGPGKFKFG
jgi:hypothetical protein